MYTPKFIMYKAEISGVFKVKNQINDVHNQNIDVHFNVKRIQLSMHRGIIEC